jgi:2',3'-cyclic-nucleotide 2'-phosphodiesterase
VRALFVGDVVGTAAVAYLVERIPRLRADLALDVVIANAENCGPTGIGMAVDLVERLTAAGVDVVTSGNHAFDGPEVARVLALPRVLRPLNLAEGVLGRGSITIDVRGEPLTVMVLADREALALAPSVAAFGRRPWDAWTGADRPGTVIVDYHAQSDMEKQAFAHAVDGVAAAVIGTHTHEPTLPLHLLPGGTALVTDVGMTGPTGGIEGFDAGRYVEMVRGTPAPAAPAVRVANGPIVLGAVLLDIAAGRPTAITRVT